MFHYTHIHITFKIRRTHKKMGANLKNKREMKTQIKVTESLNGWSRLETTFVVESSPRWWQFWKPKVMHQEFNGSVWVKGEVSQSFAPVVETFNTKEK